MESIYQDIALRTGGNIYIGVVGPVRTGKSTLIKQIMQKLVIPNIQDPYRKERARDELPQSGSGKTIMTAEPKFVPEEAVEISPDGKTKLKIRMIDSVGYMIPGAVGVTEDGNVRMVTTPWFDYEIPMTEAAELGTKKVMQEHCSIGLVVTTDGSVTDIPREDYLEAEQRAIDDMRATGKPFLVIVNSRQPDSAVAKEAGQRIRERYGLEPWVADCQSMEEGQLQGMFQALLEAFPLTQLQVHLPRWMDALEDCHPVKQALYPKLKELAGQITCLGQAEGVLSQLLDLEAVTDYHLRSADLGTGIVSCSLSFPEKLYYEVLSDRAGVSIRTDGELMKLLVELAKAKREYDKLSDALASVKSTGYGVVMPTAEDMALQPAEVTKKGNSYGIKLKAGAPSIHMVRVDIDTELNPVVGDEQQSKELVAQLREKDPEQVWQSHIFGKSVYDMVREGLNAKVVRLPEEVRGKFRGTLTRIVNEGATGLICLIL